MMTRLPRRRGQAVIETAMVVPLLVLIMLGCADLGRAFYLKLEMSGASRAGMRMAVLGPATDIGNAVRSEPNSAIPNTAAAWGIFGPGGTDDCNPSSSGHICGDTLACPPSHFAGGQVACFAIRPCLNWAGGTCSSWGAWGSRPAAAADQAIDVLVVYRFVPATPIIASYTGSNGAFYLGVDTMGLQLY